MIMKTDCVGNDLLFEGLEKTPGTQRGLGGAAAGASARPAAPAGGRQRSLGPHAPALLSKTLRFSLFFRAHVVEGASDEET